MIRRLLLSLRRRGLLLRGARGLATPRRLEAGIDCRPGFGAGACGTIELGPNVWLERGVVLHAYGGRIAVGRDVVLGPYVVIYGHGGVEIGDAALIAMHCRIVSSNHAVPPFGTDIRSQPDVLRPTRLGRDVWLGAGVTVLGGVTIGDGAVIGAGSVVTRDIPAGAIAHGAPAVVQRWRDGAPPR